VTDELRRLADAVLYEGYILWPYRRSALKNQRRWTFGGVFPPRHSAAHPDDLAAIQVQCLLEAEAPRLDVRVRFLHVVARRVFDAEGREVDELGGVASWDEASERELEAPAGRTEIAIASGSEQEPIEGGRIVRSWEALDGAIDVDAEPLREGLYRVTVRVANDTPWAGSGREDALRRAFCSTHVVLRAQGGAFVSAANPSAELAGLAAECENVGVWPVLVGEEGARETVLASPIILSDYARIAPESPGDLFDGGEIDRLLILNVLSLSEAEQEEMRRTDPRAREILERCADLGPDELLPLHGRLTMDT
jgi:hydrogenase maturation protease